MKKSQLIYTPDFPKSADLGEDLLLIYDQILERKSPHFKAWIKKFDKTYAVSAGEHLKEISQFPKHISEIIKICENTSARQLTLVVIGGGSVGDFGGFVASVLKRGVRLIHIPSTWLAAIDSAHGGKTALNVGTAKNQIGTFYPATKIFLIKKLLMAQPEGRAFEGFSEMLKISLIAGGGFWKKFSQEKKLSSHLLWHYLPLAIAAKYKIVAEDPEEKSGYRHILNLGHTLGHVLEISYDLPHGVAINYGLDFAIRWSLEKNLIKAKEAEKLFEMPIMAYLLSAPRDNLFQVGAGPLSQYRKLLLSDKKKTKAETIRFVFFKAPGKSVIQEVTVDDVLLEVVRQREAELNG